MDEGILLSSAIPQVRLGRDWAGTVGVDDLDEDRLALHMLAQRLFLVAGPMTCLLKTGTGSGTSFSQVPCDEANEVVTGRTDTYDDPSFCGPTVRPGGIRTGTATWASPPASARSTSR